jgi:acetylornithine deacetylase
MKNALAADRTMTTALLQRLVASGTTGCCQDVGFATIICGPGCAAQARQSDGWIAQSEPNACDRLIRRLADRHLV